ncbi:MAG: Ig-like domain-containing protein [Chitinophagales bacterium]
MIRLAVRDLEGAEDSTITIAVLTNDTFGGDGPGTGSITITDNANHGTATVDNGGTPNDPTDDRIVYTPNANYNGNDTLIYQICDGYPTPGDCDTAIVYINVSPRNDLPTAVRDLATTNEDTPVKIPVLDNDTFGGDGPSTGTITIIDSTKHGIIVVNDGGTPNNPADDSITYTPNLNYNGNDTLIYQICDFDGDCDTAIVFITLDLVNDPPVANNDFDTTCEDYKTIGDVTLNDVDLDGPSKNITVVSGPTHGSIILNLNGTYTYTPTLNYNGRDTVVYSYCDLGSPNLCDTATLYILITPVNDSVAKNQTVQCDGSGNTAQLAAWLASNGGITAIGDSCYNCIWTNNFTGLSNGCGNTGFATVTFTNTFECDTISTKATFTIIDTIKPALTTARDTIVQCDGSGNAGALSAWLANNGGATASDICSGVIWTNNFDSLTNGCGATGTALVTFTATDSCGNADSTTARFTIVDTIKPSITTTARDTIVQCDGSGNAGALSAWLANNGGATASDICSGVIWTNNFDSLTNGCGATGTALVTFTATDSCGNADSTTARFTIVDTIKPSITTTARDTIVQCDGSGNAGALSAWLANNGGATASDICSGVIWTNNFDSLTNGCGATGTALVTFTATDSCGNADSTTARFTIVDTIKPSITTTARDTIVQCDGSGNAGALSAWLANNGGATASDICSGVIWTNNFDSLTNGCGATGTALVTFTATDSCGNADSTTARFTIVDTIKPSITTTARDTIVQCDGSGNAGALSAWLANNGGATASDICSGVIWTNNFDSLTNGCGATGTALVTFTATDSCGNADSTTARFTIVDTIKPSITTTARDTIVQCDGSGNAGALSAWLANNGGATASDICSGVIWTNNFDSLTNGCGATGTALVTFTATDSCGNADSTTARFTIVDTIKPSITTTARDTIVQCDGSGNAGALSAWLANNGGATASDICSGVIWTNNFDSLTNGCGATGTALVTFTATDSCGNADSTTARFTIVDTIKPSITTTARDTIVQCDGSGNAGALSAWLANNGGATASDICSGVIWTNNFDSLTNGCGATGTALVTFTATDSCGNADSTTARFTIVDTIRPDFVEPLPGDLNICANVPNPVILTATDNCGTAVVTFAEVIDSASVANTIIYTRTWTATDLCNNTNTHTQVITVSQVIQVTLDKTICEGQTYQLGVNAFGLTGVYTDKFTSILGCDSIVTLNLTVNPVKHTDVDAVICQGESINVGGQVFTTSQSDKIITLSTADGCDSIIKLNVVVLNEDTIVSDRAICVGDFISIGGNIYNTAGTYYLPFANNQCSGTLQLNLTTKQPTSSTVTRTICEGQVTTVGGHVFNTAGNYSVVIPNAAGCDSNILVTVIVTPRPETIIDSTICYGQNVLINGVQYNTTGSYTITLTSAANCDSIIKLNLVVLHSGDTTTVNQTICQGESTTVGGQTFSTAGTYFINSSNPSCTDVTRLILTVNPNSTSTLDKFICEGEAIVIGGQTFTTAGTYTITLQNSTGCDSIITLNLNVSQGGAKTQLDTTICYGGSVTYAGQTFTKTGTYQIVYPVNICRDTILLNLVVNPQIETTIDETICEGQTYTIGGNSYGLTGFYTATLTSATGCDSIVHVNLTVNPVKRTNVDAVICQGESVNVGGQVITTSVTNQIITLAAANGCDSIITVNVVVLNSDTVVTNRTICQGGVVDIGGHLYNTAGTHYIAFQNAQCSGTVQLNLTVNGPSTSTETRTICDGEVVTVAGQVFSTAGTFTVTTANSLGCDSIITLTVVVNPNSNTTIDSTICVGSSVTIGGQTFASTGNYSVALQNTAGCDSTVSLNLIVIASGDTTDVTRTICEGDSTTVGGQTFTTAGTYYINSTNPNCTNVTALTVVVNAISRTTVDKSICVGQAVTVGGQTFTTSGTYTVTLQNSTGCDSIVTLNLNVTQGGDYTELDTTICFGNSVTYAGQTFSKTGRYQIIYPNGDCRDTILLVLTVNPVYNITIDSTICEGNTVTVGGNAYGLTGNYQVRLTSASGCDSIVNLNLTVNPIKRTNVDAVICLGQSVTVGGQIYTTSQTGTIITLTTTKGCDSIITLNLTVLNNDTIVTNRTICDGDFTTVGNQDFYSEGTYYIPFQNGQCTGTVQLNLTVNPNTASILNQEICQGDVFVIAGRVYATEGTYTLAVPNSLGCDSIITLNLTVNPKVTTTIDSSICRGDSVVIGSKAYKTTGTFTTLLQTSKGCDSTVVLNLIVLDNGDTTRLTRTICDNDSVVVNGQTYTTAGVYYIDVANANCTNIIELTVVVKPTSSTVLDKNICEGESIVVGGQTFNTTGTYVVTLQNSTGCDSIVTLNLNVYDGGGKTQLDTAICEGSAVTYAGQTFSKTGTYQIVYPNGVCRDTILLNLTVHPTQETTIDETICEGQTYTIGGNSYGLTGFYTATLTSATGCDSIVHVNLTVNPVKRTNVDAVICQGESVNVGGQVITTSVTNQIITLAAANGCDSIITVNVVVLNSDTVVTNRTICQGGVVDIGGHLYNTAGTHYIAFQNAQCSGTVQLNLTVNGPSTSTETRTICDGEVVTVAGQVFSTAGTFTVTTANSLGCDSIITLTVNVAPESPVTIDSTVCLGRTVIIGGQVFGSTGTYTINLQNAAGCDSTVTLNLVVLTSNGDTTKVTRTICEGDSTTVSGQTFTTAGTYYVSSTTAGCTNLTEVTVVVNAISRTTVDKSICIGQAVTVGGQTFTTSGTYTVTLQNSTGCDSIVTLNLNVTQGGDHTEVDSTICFGGSVTYAGQTFSTTGRYQIIYPNGDCRDTILLVLTVNPVYNITIDSTICEGNTVTIGSNAYGLTGNYQVRLTSASGCDSIVNLNLTVNPIKRTNVDAVICLGQSVTVGGQIYTTSQTGTIITLTTTKGCDSIITLNLTVLNNDTIVSNRTICEGDFTQVGDSIFTQAGTYYIPFQNGQCTGTVQLNLTVNPNTASTLNQEICQGNVFVIAGQVYATQGTYTLTVPNSLGCDSIITLNLTVNPKVTTTIDSSICRGDSVVIGTNIFKTTGTFTTLLQTSKGCDSTVVLNLIVLDNGDTTFVPRTICDNDSVFINGQVFKTAGTYYINVANGRCTNIIALTVTVKPTSRTTIDKAICRGESIVVGGQTFNSTGTYTVVLTNSVGCDSIITLNLDVSQGGNRSQLDTTICDGSAVTYAGQTFSKTGTYQIIYPNGVCRDTILLNLVVLPVKEVTIDRAICEGSTYQLGNNQYGVTGFYTTTVPSSTGCDSIIHLNLTVNPVKRTNVDAVICQGESINVGGQIITTSVTNLVITVPAASGCDSIITVNTIVLKSDTIVTNRTICQGDVVDIGGHLFNTAGTHYITFQNGQCTGVVQLNLTVNEPTSSIITRTICAGDVITIGGQVFNTAGTYSITTTNSLGCDSVIKLTLITAPTSTTTIDTTVCLGRTVIVGGQVFGSTGNYTVNLTNAAGCDSIVNLHLVVLASGDTTYTTRTICEGGSTTVGGQTFTTAGTFYVNSTSGICTNVTAVTVIVNAISRTTVDKSICIGQAVTVGGQTFTTAGTYTVTLQNSTGCDSIVTLNLNVSPGGDHTQVDTSICFGNSVTYAGQTFSTTGRYQIIYPNGDCRDTILLNLIVNPIPEVTVDSTICEGNAVVLGNNVYSLSGNYTAVFTSAAGCDSIVHLNLTVSAVKRTNVDAVICQGESINVGGQVITTSVTNLVITIPAASGCDSVITVNTIVLKSDTIITNRTICQGGVVDIGGHLFNTAGTHYITFQNGQCTGVVQLNLTVNQQTTSVITRTICEGGITIVGGQVFSTAGTYSVVVPNSLGCDSSIKLTVIVTPKSTTTIDSTICLGSSVTIGGQIFVSSGTYTATLQNAAGCDSIVTLNLVVLASGDTTDVTRTICEGESTTVGGQTFTTAGTFYVNSTSNNCTNVTAVTVIVNAKSRTTIDKSICIGQAVTVGGQTFTTTGTYTVTLQNATGCDSIITLNLNVTQGGDHAQVDTTICFGDSVTYAGQTFSTTGRYQIIYPNGDCRDTLLLNVTVNPTPSRTIDLTICQGETVTVGGQVFSAQGTHVVVVPSSLGCDSTITLNLTTTKCLTNDVVRDTNQIYSVTEVCIPVEPSMTGHTTAIIVGCGASHSNNTYQTNDSTNCIKVTRDSTVGYNLDTICVVVCDTVKGICDTTTVIFSNTPKIDTIIRTICDTCGTDTICTKQPVGMTITTVTVDRCTQTTTPLVIATVVPGTTCIAIQRDSTVSVSVGSDTLCVIKCDTSTRICDTTVLIIIVPPTHDTIRDTLPVRDTIILCNYITPADTNVTVTACDGSTSGTSTMGHWEIDPVTHCLQYNSFSNIGNDSTICIVKCDTVKNKCITIPVIITIIPVIDTIRDTNYIKTDTIRCVPLEGGFGTIATTDIIQDCGSIHSNNTYSVDGDGCILISRGDSVGFNLDTVCVVVCNTNGICDTSKVIISNITPKDDCGLPTVVTSNGDGINDYFYIPCPTQSAVEFDVFNRWGIEVYRSTNYGVNGDYFNGTYKGSPLPDGTYYYVIKYINDKGELINKASYLTLHR